MKTTLLISLLVICGSLSSAYSIDDPNFFPLGVWLQSTPNAVDYKAAGINLYIGLWDSLDQTQLSDLHQADMKVICDQLSFGLNNLNDSIIYGWIQMDEPDNAQWNDSTQNYDPCVPPAILIERYNQMKTNDPVRPVFQGLGQGVAYIDYIGRGACHGNIDSYKISKDGYTKAGDIISFDIYPVNSNYDETRDKLWYVAKGIDSLYSWSDNKKQIWTWIETTQITADSPRKPTPEEVKAEVWMALIHGAKGIGYFCHSWTPSFDEAALLHDSIMIKSVKNINERITTLAAVLNSSNTSGYATVSSSNINVPVDFMTKNNNSNNYIFAVAMRNDTTTATFSIQTGNRVEVIGENRTIEVLNGIFQDEFVGFGVHLYKISIPSDINERVTKNITLNLFPNPSYGIINLSIFGLNSEYINLTLYNLEGETLYSNIIQNSNKNKYDLDFSGFPTGIYFLKVSCGEFVRVEKVVLKEK